MGIPSSKENPIKPDINEAKPLFPWKKERLVGQKAPLKLKEVWAIRIRLQLAEKVRDLALLKPSHRQQTTWLRFSQLARLRHFTREEHLPTRYRHAAQDALARAIRNY